MKWQASRDDAQAKILLVGRSRKGTLLYPELQIRAGKESVFSLSLRELLIEQTCDPFWPKLVDLRELLGLLIEDLPATLQAYHDLRQAAPNHFSDSDLYKIALGASLKINPFKKLSPSEIRRLCIEQHTILESLKDRLSADVYALAIQ